MTSKQLAEMTIVVAGGNGGLGSVIAQGLKERGAHVVIADVMARSGGPFPHVLMEATDRDSVHQCFEQVESQHGPIHGLLNAVGVP